MKILYIGNKLNKHGLSKTSVETLGELFVQEGYQVMAFSDKKNFFLRFLEMGFKVIQYRNKANYLIIDTYSTLSFYYAILCGFIATILGIKYIPILRGGNLPSRIKKSPWLSNMLFKNAFVNIAPSGYLLNEFKNAGFLNIQFIPNVLEIKNYLYKERKSFRPKLLWVRSFASIYNPKMAIDVLFQLKQKYPEATLCMIGPDKDGSLIDTKKYAESLNLTIEFTGGMTKEAWIKKAEDFDIFINTTHFDNTPISVMEAMALGLPVVSTNVGGIPYLLEHEIDSFLVEDANVQQMVHAVENLIENPVKAKEIVINARKKVEKFDWNVVKEQWKTILT